MNDVKMMGSLSDRLLSFVSTALVRDANYDIAVALLRHYPQLKGLTLSQIADLCYTSNASISRFCRFLGMDNFKEFQAWMDRDFTMRTDYSRQFYTMLHNNHETAISAYRDALIGNIYTTIAPENAQVIPDIVRVLHDCGKAAYFSHHFLWDIGHYFQSKMMMMGRYVELFMDYGTQLECARSLTEKDFAIICSVGGSYLTRYPDICNAILSSGCKVLIITQNLASPYLNTADFILQCGTTNRNDVGKYAALPQFVIGQIRRCGTHAELRQRAVYGIRSVQHRIFQCFQAARRGQQFRL